MNSNYPAPARSEEVEMGRMKPHDDGMLGVSATCLSITDPNPHCPHKISIVRGLGMSFAANPHPRKERLIPTTDTATVAWKLKAPP